MRIRRSNSAPAHRVTPRGVTGKGGGRWGTVPVPPSWYASSTQICGFYPFAAGAARPGAGTPLGRDIEVGTAVAIDMDTAYQQGLVSSSTLCLMGLNGNGKSSFAQRLMYGMHYRGMAPAVFDPLKGEHSAMVRALGGQVISIGPRSRDRINPLDLGALGDAAARIGGTVGDELRELAVTKAVDLVALIVQVNRGTQLRDIEDTALGLMVRSVIERIDRPWIQDLLATFETPPPEVVAQTGRVSAEEFKADFKDLRDAVLAIAHGDLGYLIGGRESVRLEVGNPGGFCFDTSSIPDSNSRLISAAMLATWSIGFSTIDAHWELSQHDPTVRWGGYLALQDEFWYPMRACEGIIDRADRVGRTNRGLGVSELKVMHTPKDSLSLANPHDRQKAIGFAQRSGMLGLMALSLDDLHYLSENVVPLNAREIALVNSFNSPPGWRAQVDPDGRPLPPPGAGKILLKVPGRVGIPVQMTLTAAERELHITDERSRRTPHKAEHRADPAPGLEVAS